jgi:hypothetical protein
MAYYHRSLKLPDDKKEILKFWRKLIIFTVISCAGMSCIFPGYWLGFLLFCIGFASLCLAAMRFVQAKVRPEPGKKKGTL